MKDWKIIVIVKTNDKEEKKAVFIRNAETIEEAYFRTKDYFTEERLDIDFCRVVKIIEI